MFMTMGGRLAATGVALAGMWLGPVAVTPAHAVPAGDAARTAAGDLPLSEGVPVLRDATPNLDFAPAVPAAARGRWVAVVPAPGTNGRHAVVTGTVGKSAAGSSAAASVSATRTLTVSPDMFLDSVATDGKAVAWITYTVRGEAAVYSTEDAGASAPVIVKTTLPAKSSPIDVHVSGRRIAWVDGLSGDLFVAWAGSRTAYNVTADWSEAQDFALDGSKLTWTAYAGNRKAGSKQYQSINTLDLVTMQRRNSYWTVPSYRFTHVVTGDQFVVTSTPEAAWDPEGPSANDFSPVTLTRYGRDLTGRTVLATHVPMHQRGLFTESLYDFVPQLTMAGDRLTYATTDGQLVQRSVATTTAKLQRVACTPGGGDYPRAIGGSDNPGAVAWLDHSAPRVQLVVRTKPTAGELGTKCAK